MGQAPGTDGTVDAAALIAVLASRADQVVRRAARRALAEVPEYAARVTEQELAEGIARDLALAMAAFAEGREPTEEDRAAMRLIGDQRAQQGLPVEGMVRVYRFAIDEAFRAIAEAAEEGDVDLAQALALIQATWHYAGPMVEGAVGAYRRREVELAVADGQRRTELVLSLLLSPRGAPPGLAAAVGLDPARRYLAFRARADEGADRALLLDLQLPGVLDRGLVAPYEGDVVGLAAARPSTATSGDVAVGVGPLGRLDELPRSFVVASRVLETAVAHRRRGVLGIEDVTLEAIAQAEGVVGDALADRYVRPLAGEPAVLETVAAFLAHDLSAEAAAQELAVHPNTVRNRLRRFEQVTGASLRAVRDLAEVRLALLRVGA
ncbi:CdaR family transcriptional regulator [Conexibacter sp. SYSU D00693]|uniref:PucR family transcriptional regulator n=1 Tax=Conexibacter sp. SYSU D00693 TaxID=2812560 RepID=UPI00196AB1B9|nr:helix-turn-helix domain-containing protein [Conexibacter sp. SYSU D00693]